MAFSTHDIVPDSPTNNFATLNRLQSFASSHDELTISNGNLKGDVSSTADQYGLGFSTIQLPKSGKFYAEILVTYDGDGNALSFGCVSPSSYIPTSNSFAIYSDATFSGIVLHQYSQTVRPVVNGSLGTTISFNRTNTILGIVFDIDNSSMTGWYNNNQLTIASNGINYDNFVIAIESSSHANNRSDFICNFGQDPTFVGNKNTPATVNGVTGPFAPSGDAAGTAGLFYYPPPADALALCTANLRDFTPTVTGDTPQDYFKAVIWTGQTNAGAYNNGNVTVGFQPDLVWIKNRDQADGHRLFTSSTGVHNYFQTDSATTGTSTTSLTSFNSTGFSIGTEATVNTSGEEYVAWCWAAGSSETNNDGTIQSTIRRNVNSGISIVQYTGNGNASSTVGHGLSTVDCILGIQNISGHIHFPNILGLNYMQISSDSNATSDAGSSGTFGNFTSSTFGFRSGSSNINGVNTNGSAYTVLVFQNVEGYSKFGSYTGNGSADGPFVYCGFRPAFVMYKNIGAISSAFASWGMIDSSRSSYNPTGGGNTLWANMSTQEGYRGNGTNLIGANDYLNFDFVSNGFKLRGSGSNTETNDNAQTYIFMAFAEQPFKFSNAR